MNYQDIFDSTKKSAKVKLRPLLRKSKDPILKCLEILEWGVEHRIDPRTSTVWDGIEEKFNQLRERSKSPGRYERRYDRLLQRLPTPMPRESGRAHIPKSPPSPSPIFERKLVPDPDKILAYH